MSALATAESLELAAIEHGPTHGWLTRRQAQVIEMFEGPMWDRAMHLFRGMRGQQAEAERVVDSVVADVARDCPTDDDAIVDLMGRLTTERCVARRETLCKPRCA